MKVKVQPPVIADLQQTEDMNAHIAALLAQHEDPQNLHFKNETFEYVPPSQGRLEFCGCVFEKCAFGNKDAKGLSFVDTVFKGCDLSNVNFSKSTFMRVAFVDCKALGTGFSDAVWNNVLIQNGIFRYAYISASKLGNVLFAQSDQSNLALEQCTLKSVAFTDCSLEKSEFSFTPLRGIDFSSCSIRGISAHLSDLKGVCIASHQALDLMDLLGVVLIDEPGK